MYALVDCNNFYASCERLFRPDLNKKPIIVLSGGHGCVIARSNEAKALGIGMSTPYFQIRDLCRRAKVAVFASNFPLYGNLSDRVMYTIEEAWPHVEIYSIDEAFLALHSLHPNEQTEFAQALQQRILKHIGIPTSIGIGKTKTLAKLANYLCKNVLHVPVINLMQHLDLLQFVPLEHIWGIGKKGAPSLNKKGFITVLDLMQASPRQFPLPLQRIILELNGIEAHEHIESSAPPQSIIASRSFEAGQTQKQALNEALSDHCKRAYDKLRRHHLLTGQLQIFLRTSPHQKHLPQYRNASNLSLAAPTDDLSMLTKQAKKALDALYRPGFAYKKLGIGFYELTPKAHTQFQLTPRHQQDEKTERWLDTLDKINQKYGRHTIGLAAGKMKKAQATHLANCSPAYTTQWKALPIVN